MSRGETGGNARAGALAATGTAGGASGDSGGVGEVTSSSSSLRLPLLRRLLREKIPEMRFFLPVSVSVLLLSLFFRRKTLRPEPPVLRRPSAAGSSGSDSGLLIFLRPGMGECARRSRWYSTSASLVSTACMASSSGMSFVVMRLIIARRFYRKVNAEKRNKEITKERKKEIKKERKKERRKDRRERKEERKEERRKKRERKRRRKEERIERKEGRKEGMKKDKGTETKQETKAKKRGRGQHTR